MHVAPEWIPRRSGPATAPACAAPAAPLGADAFFRRPAVIEAQLSPSGKRLAFSTPFGPATFRALDHQSTMGAYVGRLDQRAGKGTMVDWRYADGRNYLPTDAEVRSRRPPEAMK